MLSLATIAAATAAATTTTSERPVATAGCNRLQPRLQPT